MRYLRGFGTPGIQVSTFSEKAKDFFIKTGFRLLYTGKRSYLLPYLGNAPDYYVLGTEL
jgi:hypothetical protein